MNAYVQRVYEGLCARNAHEKEFLQAAEEMLTSLSPVFDKHPEYEKAGLLDRAEAARAAPQEPLRRKSDCRLAHEFNDQALAFPRLQLTERQKAVLKEWVVEQCRDPDAPQAET